MHFPHFTSAADASRAFYRPYTVLFFEEGVYRVISGAMGEVFDDDDISGAPRAFYISRTAVIGLGAGPELDIYLDYRHAASTFTLLPATLCCRQLIFFFFPTVYATHARVLPRQPFITKMREKHG